MMGTELMRVCVKEENGDHPPGFNVFSSVTVNNIKEEETEDNKQDRESLINRPASANPSKIKREQIKLEVGKTVAKGVRKSLRRRACVKYNECNNNLEDEAECKEIPKGVVRGCTECSSCQKAFAKWRPEDARRPDIEDAPVFYPTEEEFKDTLNYIASIRPTAERYGICRIVPPPSWRPPCPLKTRSIWESSEFSTRVQRVDKLQNREVMRKKSQSQMRKKRRKCMNTSADSAKSHVTKMGPDGSGSVSESFGFESGPDFTLDSFEKYANEFKRQYFREGSVSEIGNGMDSLQNPIEPSLHDIEGEYWRLVEKPTEEIEVLYGADLETGAFGSGFPKESKQSGSTADECYTKSGWNLNNFPRLPGSVLTYESSDISGVLVPWLYVGMCFSSFCWHVEDHHFYSLNYMHFGSPKLWYGVPGSDATNLETAMKKHLPHLFEEQPDLLHKLVTQLSPSVLKSEGVPVYRCTQNSGEFVLTLPRAYHAGFNSGFNCAEAVNVAPVDWLPHGQTAVELYRSQGRRTSVSHDKLLLGAAREAVKAHWEIGLLRNNTLNNLRWKDVCGKNGILAKTFKERVEAEKAKRESLCKYTKSWKMESNFDANCERECSICLFDLHLSAMGCLCSPDQYACLDHTKQLCQCTWDSKYFLFRYNIDELDVLVEALEGKLGAIYRWAKQDLGLSLNSQASKDQLQASRRSDQISHTTEGLKEPKTQSSISYIKELLLKNLSKKTKDEVASHGLAGSQTSHDASNSRKVDSKCLNVVPDGQLTQERGAQGPSSEGHTEIILLSDDGDEKPQKKVSGTPNGTVQKLVETDRCGSTCNSNKETSQASRVVKSATKQVEANSSSPGEQAVPPSSDGLGEKERTLGNLPSVAGHVNSETSEMIIFHNNNNSLNAKEMVIDTVVDSNAASSGVEIEPPLQCSTEKPVADERHEKSVTVATSLAVDTVKNVTGSSSLVQNNLDRYFRQKGPRIAKVVRRINCNVEPLEYGLVLAGKLWSNSNAIFPKGFRSRVKYFNVLDPISMCFYISEILYAGEAGPMFKVSLEHCPSEIFIHVSPTKCWEMVREQVNQEITKQHRMGKKNLAPFQPPGSVDGFEMFGFTSPAIVQAIEAMDGNRICSNYWESRAQVNTCNRTTDEMELDSTSEIQAILKNMLKKANLEEVLSLRRSLDQNNSTLDSTLLTRLLNEEILNRALR